MPPLNIGTRCQTLTFMLAHLYILASKINGTLYIGTTINLINRLQQHRSDVSRSFTAKYNVHRLVHVETFPHIVEARRREVQLKRWKRQWKIELIEGFNPSWRDLADDL